jgi:hypothetical protein
MTYGNGTATSDSVNLGSNPSPPATLNSGFPGLSLPHRSAEQPAQKEQTAHTGRTEVGTPAAGPEQLKPPPTSPCASPLLLPGGGR